MSQNLDALFNRHRTDKGSNSSDGHCFGMVYGFLLREPPKSMLEIGIGDGGSIKAWRELFPYCHITGLDINYCYLEGVETILGSQSDPVILARLADRHFDLIIDDGSHLSYDVRASFTALWPSIPVGGIYVIEDMHVGAQHGFPDEQVIFNENLDRLKQENKAPCLVCPGKGTFYDRITIVSGELMAFVKVR